MPEGDHALIGLHYPYGANMTRFKRETNLQGRNGRSTCHDGLLAAVTFASQEAAPSGVALPETRPHSWVVVVSVEYASRTLPRCWQRCRKCNFAHVRQCIPASCPGRMVWQGCSASDERPRLSNAFCR